MRGNTKFFSILKKEMGLFTSGKKGPADHKLPNIFPQLISKRLVPSLFITTATTTLTIATVLFSPAIVVAQTTSQTPATAKTLLQGATSATTTASSPTVASTSSIVKPVNTVTNLKGFGLPQGITGYTDYTTTSSTLMKKNTGVGARAEKELPYSFEPLKGQVSVIPVPKQELDKYDYEENYFWTKKDDIIQNFSIRTAQAYYNSLYEYTHDNFLYPLSYKDISNRLLKALSGFTEQISIDTSTGRILIHNKDFKLIGNYKNIADDDKEGWVDIFINTIINLRKSSKTIGNATQEQIHYLTTMYLLKDLDENATYFDPVANTDRINKMATTTLGFTYRKTKSGLQVLSITKDSPVYFSDIRTGDIITHINATPTPTLSDEQIEYILGGTDMDIMHINYVSYISKQPAEVYLRKNRTIIPSTTANLIDGVPVISIANFKTGSARELKQSIDLLADGIRKTGGLILDLRGNIKGDAIEAIEAANLFIDGKTLLTSTRKVKDAETKTYTAKSGDILNGAPIVILVDNTTKGAAEIFASIFDGRSRAVIIGTPTFGEGTISATYTLPDKSSISFATEEVQNAKSLSPNKTGVVPLICTSNILTDSDIQKLKSNIRSDKFIDHRPDTNNKTVETISVIRNSCKAIYPNKATENMNTKIATAILTDPEIYKKLIKK